MNRETREYQYDWMLWSILDNAAKSYNGSPKEYQDVMRLVPNFNDVLDMVIRQGEPGIMILKAASNYLKRCMDAHSQGKKVALTTFCFAPPILYAFDVTPIMLEGMTVMGTLILRRGTAEYLDYCCEVGFTETSCSAQRGALGAYLSGLAVRPDFIVCDTPGMCDTNANSYAFASAYLDIPFFQLNYPPTLSDDRARQYHNQDFRNMISFIEEQTGTKLDINKMRTVIEELKVQDKLICELSDLQTLVPSPMPGIFNFFLYTGNFLLSGTREYTDLLECMLEKVRENARLGIAGTGSKKERARCLFSYIDHYTTDLRFWNWLDKNEISHLGCILSTYWQEDAPYASTQPGATYSIDDNGLDAMIDTMAAQMSRMPMVKSIRGPYDAPNMWLDDTLSMKQVFKLDFVTYLGTMGCRNTWGMLKSYARDLERLGVPTLILNSDSFDDRVTSWESVTDKLAEFITLRRIGHDSSRV